MTLAHADQAANTAEIGFEKQIWAAADKLRGSTDAAEHKHVVLGLIFLKYISDTVEAIDNADTFHNDFHPTLRADFILAKGKTLFIDARGMGTLVNRRRREMTSADIAKIAAAFEALDAKMERLTAELSGLFAEGRKLEKEIKKRLGAIGWEV